ncbi:MAG: tryptophan synthase subunit alpha [Tepidisphaerales bacterium]
MSPVPQTVSPPADSRLKSWFSASRAAGRLALMPFVPAGYPSLEATRAVLCRLGGDAAGGVIEVGIPFSDPIADGPVIQAAFAHALQQGVTLDGVLSAVAGVRERVAVPLVAMVSYSLAFRRGVARFFQQLREAGFDGLILPDLPPPEAEPVVAAAWAAGLETALLSAPTTPPERRRTIAALSSGFVYCLSVTGITGERRELPAELSEHLAGLRAVTERPLCVGFGISSPEHLRMLQGKADGAIVGSALVRRMREQGDAPDAVARASAAFCENLRGG